LVELLTTFNGAELFIDAMPMVTFFGVGSATNPALDLGIYTKKWRSSRPGNTDWLIGVMNYGGFFVLNSAGLVAEWDSAQPGWLTAPCTPEELTTRLLSEGMDYLCDI
jgi:hypothetical protein